MSNYPNIIFLTIDALRADHVGYHGYGRETTPFLDSLADQVVRFDTAISASSHTREAVPSLLTGRHPHTFAADGYKLIADSVAGMVGERGYATAGFHSNPYLSRAYGYDTDFDTFYDDLYLGNNRLLALVQRGLDKFVFNRGEYHARAAEINRRSLSWIDSIEDATTPIFLWNHYMDVHGPYNPPDFYWTDGVHHISDSDAQKLYQKTIDSPEDVSKSERDLLIDLYDDEIRYLDAKLGEFFDALDERNLLEESLIVVTADHGDAFGERGYFTHPRYPHEELLHVPLLISTPNDDTGTIKTPVSTLDIVPTIAEWAGIDDDGLPGDPLVDAEAGLRNESLPGIVFSSAQGEDENADIRRFAIRDKTWLCEMDRDIESGDVVSRRVFDVQSDSIREREIEATPERVDELFDKLHTESTTKLTGAGISRTEDVPADVSERLDALGYK